MRLQRRMFSAAELIVLTLTAIRADAQTTERWIGRKPGGERRERTRDGLKRKRRRGKPEGGRRFKWRGVLGG